MTIAKYSSTASAYCSSLIRSTTTAKPIAPAVFSTYPTSRLSSVCSCVLGPTPTTTTQIVKTTSIIPPPTTTTVPATATPLPYFPYDLPYRIYPAAGPPLMFQDGDIKRVIVAFKEPFDYRFLNSNKAAQTQVFTYLPQGVAHGLGIPLNAITMHSMSPWDTQSELGYVQALAHFYIYWSYVPLIATGLANPSSAFYSNPDPAVSALMGLVNGTTFSLDPSQTIPPHELIQGGK
jgi:hypothetical protein